jgi:hypothetical protein
MIDLKGKREVAWDTHAIEYSEGIRIAAHKPTRKNVALHCTGAWEGVTCGYPSVVKLGDKYRLYYRASGKSEMDNKESFCFAESDDGVTFTKSVLGKFEFAGSKENNIFHREDRFIDNFSVHLDTNPDCPPEEKFKALSLVSPGIKYTPGKPYPTKLALYTSPDGISFKFERILPIKGVFDTHQIATGIAAQLHFV